MIRPATARDALRARSPSREELARLERRAKIAKLDTTVSRAKVSASNVYRADSVHEAKATAPRVHWERIARGDSRSFRTRTAPCATQGSTRHRDRQNATSAEPVATAVAWLTDARFASLESIPKKGRRTARFVRVGRPQTISLRAAGSAPKVESVQLAMKTVPTARRGSSLQQYRRTSVRHVRKANTRRVASTYRRA